MIGQEQPEAFREWDVWASWRLPWERHESSGWGVDTRLLTSAGLVKGAESTALVVSVLPVLTLGDRGARFNVDLGVGVAVLSQHRFDRQDFGGHLQGALTFGVSVSPFRHAGFGLPVHALLGRGRVRLRHDRRRLPRDRADLPLLIAHAARHRTL